MSPKASVSPWLLVLLIGLGGAVGHFTQTLLSGMGRPPFVPPVSLPASLVIIALVLWILAIRLTRAIERKSEQPVNPFHAVRLLAGARAGQFSGALFAGFGAGLIVEVTTRTVPAGSATWIPMIATSVAAVILMVTSWFAERACRVPPEDPQRDEGDEALPEGEPDVA